MFTYRFAVNVIEADGLVHLPSCLPSARAAAAALPSMYIVTAGGGASSPLV